MARLRFRSETIDFNVDVPRLAREHPPLERVRRALIDETGDVAVVDQYLSHRLAAAFGKFGHDYLGETSARIDRIFAIRDDLANSVDAALRGETVHIDALKNKFGELDHELDQLKSPTKAAEQATALDAPRDPPPQTAPAEAPSQATAGGAGGGTRPPDHLSAIARTEKVRDGLRVVENQTAAPALRSQLAAIAQTSPDLAQDLLRGIARFLTPETVSELQGISHFLDQGGSPQALKRLFAPTGRSGSPTPDLRAGLRMMREFDAEAARGVAVVFGSGYTAGGVLEIFYNCRAAPGLAPGIFASLANLENVKGLDKVIAFLGGRPENFKAVQGQLLTANDLKRRYPGALLVFEEGGIGPDGRIRVPDIQVWGAPGGVPVNVEVKFYTMLDSIGSDAHAQLASDLARDAERRRTYPHRDGSVAPPFAAMLWRFERGNLAKELTARLGRQATEAELAAEIKRRLRAVFTKHETMLRRELGAEFDTYKAAFDNAAFLELY